MLRPAEVAMRALFAHGDGEPTWRVPPQRLMLGGLIALR
jgi:hypothetical protein